MKPGSLSSNTSIQVTPAMNRVLFTGLVGFLLYLPTYGLQAQVPTQKPREIEGIDVTEHLGSYIPDTLQFVDEQGHTIQLGDLLHKGKPVVVNFVYYNCPMLCGFVLEGFTKAIKPLDWTPGKEFEIITISFDPKETPAEAREAKESYIKMLGKPEAGDGWHFLTASAEASTALARAVGFAYKWDERTQQYVHPTALVFLSPEGKITRYLYGIDYPPQDMRLALLESAQGKVGASASLVDRVLLYCYQYDPEAGSYSLVATNIMKLGGLITLLALGVALVIFWIHERRKLSLSAVPNPLTQHE